MRKAERHIHHNDPDHATYYLAHELAHAWAYVKGGKVNLHGDDFYKEFKRLCPPKLWHYELQYKTRDAKRAGISPDPATNVNNAGGVPNVIRETRPTPTPSVDVKELRRQAIAEDPKIEKKLATVPDHDVKSYIRGWFQLTH